MVSLMLLVVGLIDGGACVIIGIKSPPPFATLGMLAGERAIAVFLVAKSRGPHLQQSS